MFGEVGSDGLGMGMGAFGRGWGGRLLCWCVCLMLGSREGKVGLRVLELIGLG